MWSSSLLSTRSGNPPLAIGVTPLPVGWLQVKGGHHRVPEGAPTTVVRVLWLENLSQYVVGDVRMLDAGKPQGSDHPRGVVKTCNKDWMQLEAQ